MRASRLGLALSLLFFGFSCSFVSKRETKPTSNSFTVDWNKVDSKPVPKIIEGQAPVVGPAPLDSNSNYSKKITDSKTPTALILGAGVYRTISHIALLKEMRVQSHEPQVILGHGLASIVAAYYAYGYEPDYIEWKFFKFLNELKDDRPFTSDWLKAAQGKLLDELRGKTIEGGKLTLLIPVKDLTKNKVLFKKRGDLYKYLLANIDPKGLVSKKLRPAFTEVFVDKKPLLNIGVGRILGVDLLTAGINWKLGSGFLNGVFEKGATVTLNSEQKLDIMVTYPLANFKVDDKKDVADLVYKSKELAREKLALMIEKPE